jgi:hypothetical protein
MTNRKTKLTLYISVLLIVGLNTLFAQNAGKISGVVTDAQTGENLIGTNIVVMGTSLGGSTDLEGSFFILNVPAGKYNVQASMMGYEKVILRDVIVNSNRTTNADFKLKATTLEQEAVIVEATRPDVEPEKTSTSTIIRSDEVQAIAGMRDVSDVIGLAADVADGHFRGGRSNEEYYTLQGMGIVNPWDATAAFRPIMSAVEEVEVITSGFGAQYGNAQSGVVNITMKEGKSDRWRATAQTRMRSPGQKYFGASVFDVNANPYLQKMNDTAFWNHGDLSTSYNAPWNWVTIAYGNYNSVVDTATARTVMKTLWNNVVSRDLNRKSTSIDYSVEAAAGGPIDEGVTMFLALRSEVTNPLLPTEDPDQQQQIMGNLVFDLGSGTALRVSGGYQYQFTNYFPTGTSFYQWIWDRNLGIQFRKNTNHQIGIRFTKALSPRTFLEVKLNGLRTENYYGSSPWYNTINDQVRNMETGTGIIERTGAYLSYIGMQGKSFQYLANAQDDFVNERTLTISLDASFTSQVTRSHLISGGFQMNYYRLDVNDISNIASKGSITWRDYKGNPYEIGAYVQDKMEFEGMIANVGLRWDLWNTNSDFFADQFNPFTLRDASGNLTFATDPELAAKEKSTPVNKLQPRVGVSFPVSTMTVFHLNYGTFMQRPSFQYVLSATKRMLSTKIDVGTLGNPRLNPQTTSSYDIGVMQGLGEGFTLDVSGYYKDIRDLADQSVYTDAKTGTSYNSYFNRAYADVRGLRIALAKRRSALSGSINYQYSVATGKSSSPNNAPIVVTRDRYGNISTDIVTNIPIKDVLLNFDRTHNLIVNFAYITSDEWGPSFNGIFPFSNMTLSSNTFARSGRPYTPPSNPSLVNTSRSPAEYNTNIKISKTVNRLFGIKATLYVEIFNLFENKIFSYNYLFNTANKADINAAALRYETYPLDDPNNGALYFDDQNQNGPYALDHSFMLYDNQPRAYYFGINIEL